MKGQTAYKEKSLLLVQLQAWLDQETQTVHKVWALSGAMGLNPSPEEAEAGGFL